MDAFGVDAGHDDRDVMDTICICNQRWWQPFLSEEKCYIYSTHNPNISKEIKSKEKQDVKIVSLGASRSAAW